MVWGIVLKDSHRPKEIYRIIGRRLFQSSQVKGDPSPSRPPTIDDAVSFGCSISLLLGMASVSHYIYTNGDESSDKYFLLQNVAVPRSILRPNTSKAHCESRHSSSNNDEHHSSSLSPTLPYRILKPNPHLEIAFCTRTRNPIYVLEKNVLYTTMDDDKTDLSARINSSNSGRSLRLGRHRRPNFFEEKSIPTNMRSRLSDYKHSGWDRGHMAPAADFALNNRTIEDHNGNQKQQIEEQLMEEKMQTFNLCNISPQDASLNRGLWCKLESWVRTTIVELQKEDASHSIAHPQRRRQVHVLTGPLWLPTKYSKNEGVEYRYLGIGKPPSLVAVPSHFFKVVVAVSPDKTTGGSDRIEKFACFVMANRSTQSDAASGASDTNDDQFVLQDFLVPWSTLETLSGLELFSHLVDDEFRTRADELTLAQVHRRQRQIQAPRAPTLQLLEAGTIRGGAGQRQREDLSVLEHLCKGGKCQV